MKVIAFDLEIAKPVIEGVKWAEQRPLGISCAATLTSAGRSQLWRGMEHHGRYEDKMGPEQVRSLVLYLEERVKEGYIIITWNGLGFDFDVLAEECDSRSWAQRVADMAMGAHIDPGFQMVCERGFMIGLETAANALKVGGKTEGMHGDLAPLLWSGDLSTASIEQKENIMALLDGRIEEAGSREAQDLCLEYVGQDVKATMDVYKALVEQKEVWWVTAKGSICRYPWKPIIKEDPYERLLTVQEALRVDEPDTSWMTDPRPRSSFFEWVKAVQGERERVITL